MLKQLFLNYLVVSIGVVGVGIATEKIAQATSPVLSKYNFKGFILIADNSEKRIDLNPNPNPLVIPTQPDEVKIKNVIPISLQQAIELAKLNNRQLQITLLELEANQANLQVAEAALFPSLGVNANLTRNLDAGGELAVEAQQRAISGQANIISDNDLENEITNTQKQITEVNRSMQQLQTQLQQPINPNNTNQVVQRTNLLVQQLQNIDQLQKLQSNEQSLQSIANQKNVLDGLQNYATTAINGTLSLQYAIFSPQRQANINIASEQVRISELQVKREEEQLRLDVTLAYYDLQQADEELLIALRDVEDRSKRLEGIKLMLEATLATKLDLLNAQVELDNSRQLLINAQTQAETTRRRLAQLLSLSPTVTPVAKDEVKLMGEWYLSLEDSIIKAFQNRVELEEQLARRKQSQDQKDLASSAIIPEVSLFAEYNLLQLYTDQPDSPPDNFQARGFGDGYSFGIQFNWTFFDGGAAAAGARREDANIKIAEQQYAQFAEQIRFEVEQAFLQLPGQRENVKIAQEGVERAKEAVRAAEIRFQAGVNTQTEILDAQSRLVRAENNLVEAVLGYNRALAQLQRAVSSDNAEKNDSNDN